MEPSSHSTTDTYRVAFLRNIPVQIAFHHNVQFAHGAPMMLRHHERVHDSVPRLERVLFDIEIFWDGPPLLDAAARLPDVVNYAPVYRFLTEEFDQKEPVESPLEAVVDLIAQKASLDTRVRLVRVTATRTQILRDGEVGCVRQWVRPRQQMLPPAAGGDASSV